MSRQPVTRCALKRDLAEPLHADRGVNSHLYEGDRPYAPRVPFGSGGSSSVSSLTAALSTPALTLLTEPCAARRTTSLSCFQAISATLCVGSDGVAGASARQYRAARIPQPAPTTAGRLIAHPIPVRPRRLQVGACPLRGYLSRRGEGEYVSPALAIRDRTTRPSGHGPAPLSKSSRRGVISRLPGDRRSPVPRQQWRGRRLCKCPYEVLVLHGWRALACVPGLCVRQAPLGTSRIVKQANRCLVFDLQSHRSHVSNARPG